MCCGIRHLKYIYMHIGLSKKLLFIVLNIFILLYNKIYLWDKVICIILITITSVAFKMMLGHLQLDCFIV